MTIFQSNQPSTPLNVLITGCSSGIGLYAAGYLKNKGFHVIPTARSEKDLAQLRQLGFDPIELDVSNSESVQCAADEVIQKTNGKLYALINNAGFVEAGALKDLSREILESQFATNVFGLHQLTQALLPSMIAHRHGRIIHVSSVLGFVSRPYLGAYNASKYAVEGLADTLRLELQPHKNIHVIVVQPGPIESKLFNNAMNEVSLRIENNNHDHDHSLLKIMQASTRDHIFKKGPEAVAKVFYKGLTKQHPKTHYRVTIPCHAAYWLKRFFPTRCVDYFLGKG